MGRHTADRFGRAAAGPTSAAEMAHLGIDCGRSGRHPRRRCRRMVVSGQDQSRGRTRRRRELHRQCRRRPRQHRPAVGRRGTGVRPGDLRVVRGTRRRPRAHAGLLRDPTQRPHGQRARPPSHAAGADLHQGHVPRRFHPDEDGRSARHLRRSARRRRVPQRGHRWLDPGLVAAAHGRLLGRPAVP
mgnify:CR=1 FL=1